MENSSLLQYHQSVEDFAEATVTGRGQLRAAGIAFDSGLQVFLMARPSTKQVGGSGEYRIQVKKFSTRKSAKDAARQQGKRKPVHHPSPLRKVVLITILPIRKERKSRAVHIISIRNER